MIYLLLCLRNEAGEAAPPKTFHHSDLNAGAEPLSRSHLAAEGLGLEAGRVAGAVVHRRGDGGTSSCRRGGRENKQKQITVNFQINNKLLSPADAETSDRK